MEQKLNAKKYRKRILGTLLSALSAGVVPRSGAPYIAIGRNEEIESLTTALDRVADGEGSCKFIIGRYRLPARAFSSSCRADMPSTAASAPRTAICRRSRKLSAAGGLATYRELMKNLACRTQPDGGALPVILERWFSAVPGRAAFRRSDPRYTGI